MGVFGNQYILHESKDKSNTEKNHKRKEQYKYRTIDIHNDECYKYFDKEEIDHYRNDNRKGEILVEVDYNSAIGYIYVNSEGSVGPFKVFSDYKGRGYGEILLKDAISKYGAKKLDVYSDNKVAYELYKKLGFKEYKRKKYKNGDILIMMKL